MSILVVGSIAYDDVETPFGSAENSPGGSALHFSSAASFFTPVNIVGVVGKDFNFKIIDFLKSRNVDFSGIAVEEGETFRWGGEYFEDINQRETKFTYLNVFADFNPRIPENYRNLKNIFLANIDPDLQLQVLNQMRHPQMVIADTMNFWISGKYDALIQVIEKSNILILNDEECKQLTGLVNLIKAGKKILEMGPQYLIIKKGENGAVLFGKDLYFSVPSYPVEEVVDPTGAGDSFAGGFVGYLDAQSEINDLVLKNAVLHGSTLASFNVEDFSFKRLTNLTLKDIDERVANFKNMICI